MGVRDYGRKVVNKVCSRRPAMSPSTDAFIILPFLVFTILAPLFSQFSNSHCHKKLLSLLLFTIYFFSALKKAGLETVIKPKPKTKSKPKPVLTLKPKLKI